MILTYSNNSPKTDVSTLNGAGLSHLSEGFNFYKMEEIWKVVKGYEGRYQVSNLGNVKSLSRMVNSGNGVKSKLINEIILKPNITIHGYKIATLWIDGVSGHYSVHRLVATTFIPNPENKPMVNHINCIKTDNRVENLEWVTRQENVTHAVLNKLIPVGEKVGVSKLKQSDIDYIRDNFFRKSARCSNSTLLAKKFGVSSGHIKKIVRKKYWKD